MPPKGDFISATGYYSTILHELTHWTGHSSTISTAENTLPLTPARSWSLKSEVCSFRALPKFHRARKSSTIMPHTLTSGWSALRAAVMSFSKPPLMLTGLLTTFWLISKDGDQRSKITARHTKKAAIVAVMLTSTDCPSKAVKS